MQKGAVTWGAKRTQVLAFENGGKGRIEILKPFSSLCRYKPLARGDKKNLAQLYSPVDSPGAKLAKLFLFLPRTHAHTHADLKLTA